MLIIGCDLHTRYQQIALLETETSELVERRLEHENGEARAFYASLPPGARVGIEATIPAHWFERLLAECGHELWVGDAARIRALVVRRQKNDARDAFHLMQLLASDRFPRLWIPSLAERDARQLLVHRSKLVQMRTAVQNQLHALAWSQGLTRGNKLWSRRGRAALASLSLLPWAQRRREELLRLLEELETSVSELDRAVQAEAARRPEVERLMTHPGVGSVVGLAFVLTVGPVGRFPNSRKLVAGDISLQLDSNPTQCFTAASGGYCNGLTGSNVTYSASLPSSATVLLPYTKDVTPSPSTISVEAAQGRWAFEIKGLSGAGLP